jgi:hypothetical protein
MAYIVPNRWKLDEIHIDLDEEACEGPIATIRVEARGTVLIVMGEIVEDGERLVVTRAHVSSIGVRPNDIGLSNLRQVARMVMEQGGYDEIVVEGAFRTTGAQPGRRPRPLRFTRDSVSDAQSCPRRREND